MRLLTFALVVAAAAADDSKNETLDGYSLEGLQLNLSTCDLFIVALAMAENSPLIDSFEGPTSTRSRTRRRIQAGTQIVRPPRSPTSRKWCRPRRPRSSASTAEKLPTEAAATPRTRTRTTPRSTPSSKRRPSNKTTNSIKTNNTPRCTRTARRPSSGRCRRSRRYRRRARRNGRAAARPTRAPRPT